MADYTIHSSNDTEVAIPASQAGDEYTDEAIQALLQAAWPRYNASLKALRTGAIPEALREASAAFHVAPYSAVIAEYGLALAIQHGDFARADQLLAWSVDTGLGDTWPDYDTALDNAVRRWNLFLDDSEALREAYQSPNVSPSYRELLLLAKHATSEEHFSLTAIERSHLSAFNIPIPQSHTAPSPESTEPSPEQSTFPGRVSILSGALGLLLGAGVMFALPNWDAADTGSSPGSDLPSGISSAPDTPENGSGTSDEMMSAAQKVAQVNLALLREQPIEADDQLQRVDTTGTPFQDLFPEMRSATDIALFDYGVAAYDEEDYTTAFDALRRIEDAGTGQPQERWYYQGMAAYELERPEEAREALITLRDYLTDEYPHFDAQAAYVLVKLLPAKEARPYAERITSQYGDTIYNNSVVQDVLAGA